jgi:ferredoxin
MAPYQGEPTCAAATVLGTTQGCVYGCLGLGDCERSCPFDAIHIIDGLAVVDFTKCTACGNCVRACPRDIITIEHFKAPRALVVACCNRDPGKDTRAVCKVGCIACGICERTCDLFAVEKNLSRMDYERYDPVLHADSLREASEKCPTGCLPFRGRAKNATEDAENTEKSDRRENT